MNELLRESEATNAILMEQIKVSRCAVNVGTALISMVYFVDQMFNTKHLSENPSLWKFSDAKLNFGNGFIPQKKLVLLK